MTTVYPAGTKTCTACGLTKPLSEFHTVQRKTRRSPTARCKLCTQQHSRRYWLAHGVERNIQRNAYRAKDPRNRHERPFSNAERLARQRAEAYGAHCEAVSYAAILARDGYWCYLCQELVSPSTLSFDHVIPLEQGGPHSATNIRVTHRLCNARKSAMSLAEQRRRLVQCPKCAHEFWPQIK